MKYYAFIYRTLIIMSICSLVLQGCKKEENNNDNDGSGEFELVGYTVQDGVDTEGNPKKRVNFELSGTKDLNIHFFSGDIGGNYEFRNPRVKKLEELNLSFETNCTWGTQGCGVDVFSILASTDYNGGDTEEAVRAATWENITDKFTISPYEATNAVYHGSDVVNIADVTREGHPLYLAMRHTTYNQVVDGAVGNEYTGFRVRNWTVSGGMEGEEPIQFSTTIGEAGFKLVELGAFLSGRNSVAANLVILRGNHGAGLGPRSEQTEGWVIADPIALSDVTIPADVPLRVKQSHQPAVAHFSFNYNGPGTYNAVFVLSKEDGTEVTKEVTITIPE